MCLHEIEFLDKKRAEEYAVMRPTALKDPLRSARNIAGQARMMVSSTYEGYRAEAVVDKVVGGYPGNTSAEWASNGEKAGAFIRLTWNAPQAIDKIWLFDRPNTHADQVLAGRLEFSDGSSMSVGALPDDAASALEITFPLKRVAWIEFHVTSVKPETLNAGLAEIAVFTPMD
jgi:hypothetical protein